MFATLLVAFVALHVEPPVSLEDLGRFPSEETVGQMRALAYQHRDWITGQVQFHPEDEARWEAWRTEAGQCYSAWDLLDDARNGYSTNAFRLQQLAELRALIGYPAYYRGEMPPPVPVHRLTIH